MTRSNVSYLNGTQPSTSLENEFSTNGHYNHQRNKTPAYVSAGFTGLFTFLGLRSSPLWFIPAIFSGLFAINEFQEDRNARRQAYQI